MDLVYVESLLMQLLTRLLMTRIEMKALGYVIQVQQQALKCRSCKGIPPTSPQGSAFNQDCQGTDGQLLDRISLVCTCLVEVGSLLASLWWADSFKGRVCRIVTRAGIATMLLIATFLPIPTADKNVYY